MIAPNVLLVDDEKTVRDATAQSLLLAGYAVQTFSRAADALPLITAEFEGVIISDIRMPEMDGLEFLQHVLRIDRDLPVILISGHADVATAVSAIRNRRLRFAGKTVFQHTIGGSVETRQ